ncbi:hypothetical protein W04_2245 [Pseudoalteromonas sp. SW0106-04]|nr:hypothetical protein W04_2245 [Pseudoalteromonas sp. SW0106-04]
MEHHWAFEPDNLAFSTYYSVILAAQPHRHRTLLTSNNSANIVALDLLAYTPIRSFVG